MAAASIVTTLGLAVVATAWVAVPDGGQGQTQAPVSVTAGLPRSRTPVDQLAPSGFSHQEVLRIDQTGLHSDEAYEIVLDGWINRARPSQIAEVRLWWANTAKRDERSPFGRGVTSHVDIEYDVNGAREWTVALGRGKKEWIFEVEADERGNLHAFADIVDDQGQRVDHCQASASRLVPSRFLGVVSGIERVEVDCLDAQGGKHTGALEVHKHRRRRG